MKPLHAIAFGSLFLFAGACSLINSYDDVVEGTGGGSGGSASGGGGAGASGGGDGGAGAAGAAGGGGMGGTGGVPAFACAALGAPFDVFSSADVGAGDLDETLLVKAGPDGRVHVAALREATGELIARTVRDEELGPLVVLPTEVNGNSLRLRDMVVLDNSVLISGIAVDATVVGLPLDGGGEINPNPAPTVTTPLADMGVTCNGADWMVGTRDDAGNARFVIQCESAANRTMHLLNFTQNQITLTLTGALDDSTMLPRLYAFVGGKHAIFVGDDNPLDPGGYVVALRTGSTLAELQMPKPIVVKAGERPLFSAAVPNPMQNELTIFSLSLNPADFNTIGMYSGTVKANELADLPANPGNYLSLEYEWPSQSEFSVVFGAERGLNGIFSAGVNIFSTDKSQVELYYWGPQGDLRVGGVVVDEFPDVSAVRHTAAAAVPGNILSTLVVWAQRTMGGQFSVRARRMQCSSNSN